MKELFACITAEAADQQLLDKFLRYAVIDTQSKEDVEEYPSTKKQLDLSQLLLTELKALGIQDAELDQYGYVTATIPSNLTTDQKVPTIGFIAHVDTSPEVSGKNVKPQVIENYNGQDITLPGNTAQIIKVSENPALKDCIGKTVITSDGTTLLGADNKAGISIIMTFAEILLQHNDIKHGDIKIAFTPDEEVGAGTKFFDVKKFGADFAYTIDGETPPELNKETFSANTALLHVYGVNSHPGQAKNIMVNAIRVAADILSQLPKDIAPETTEGYKPFIHPYVIEGGIEKTTVKILLRDFKTDGLTVLKEKIEAIIEAIKPNYPKAKIELEIIEAYRNMQEGLEKDKRVIDYLHEAAEKAGLTPNWKPIRGGTDGSQLTAKGLPTPNIFTGGCHFHSLTEWVSLWGMQKSLETIFNLAQLWAEKNS